MLHANISNTTRKLVYRRDGYQCILCGSTRYLQIHHYIPRSHAGANTVQNLVTLCSDCHAMAHGTNIIGYTDLSQDEVQHLICVYLADEYAPDWRPFKSMSEWLETEGEA